MSYQKEAMSYGEPRKNFPQKSLTLIQSVPSVTECPPDRSFTDHSDVVGQPRPIHHRVYMVLLLNAVRKDLWGQM
jgi:hypothetical protein